MISSSSSYNSGYRKIEESLKKEYSVAFMCAEKDPIDCHRSIMVSKTFSDNGYIIQHLIPDKEPVSQNGIEDQLLNKYFPSRNQLSLFGGLKSDNDLIAEAYRKRNADIGNHIEEV